MKRATDHKIILVTQKTRLQTLIQRYNTLGQTKFYIEHHGGDFKDLEQEDRRYQQAFSIAVEFLESYGRLQVIDRDFVSSFLFGEKDIVVALGRDGLVANTLKYLSSQKLIGVNPDPDRWDGVLVPFQTRDLAKIVPETAAGGRPVQKVTFAEAKLNDGQSLIGVNDIFIGQRTHASARYELYAAGRKENQSSSGIIVSTGLGATGWLKSILTGAQGIGSYLQSGRTLELDPEFCWSSRYLFYTVREPYPSRSTGASLVFGKIEERTPLRITSQMSENGVIFSDGMEQDFLEFNAGASATVGICEKSGNLVV